MATTVIETLYNSTTVEQVRTISRQIGESESATSKALIGASVALLHRLAQLSGDVALMSRVVTLMPVRNGDIERYGGRIEAESGVAVDMAGAAGVRPVSSAALRVGRGTALLNVTYGARLHGLVEGLAGYAAITQPSARAVIGHAAVGVLKVLASRLDQASSYGTPAGSYGAPGSTGTALAELLDGERPAIERALPPLAGAHDKAPAPPRAAPPIPGATIARPIGATGGYAAGRAPAPGLPAPGGLAPSVGGLPGLARDSDAAGLAPPALIGGLGTLALLWWLFQPGLYSPYAIPNPAAGFAGRSASGPSGPSAADGTARTLPPAFDRRPDSPGQAGAGGTFSGPTSVTPSSTAAPAAVTGLLRLFRRTLPSNKQIEIADDGIESNMIGLIENRNQPLERTQWFEFDRLHFQTGSSNLTADSRAQVQNIADILADYPTVRIKIGGYTDNAGDPAANKRLSEARAQRVMTELITLGVNALRLDAEGYGEQHPVADNTTPEGRARNRRIAIRVTDR